MAHMRRDLENVASNPPLFTKHSKQIQTFPPLSRSCGVGFPNTSALSLSSCRLRQLHKQTVKSIDDVVPWIGDLPSVERLTSHHRHSTRTHASLSSKPARVSRDFCTMHRCACHAETLAASNGKDMTAFDVDSSRIRVNAPAKMCISMANRDVLF